MATITEDGIMMVEGDRAFNYYDREIGERICSVEFATKKGWL